jgi:hypothetical protein
MRFEKDNSGQSKFAGSEHPIRKFATRGLRRAEFQGSEQVPRLEV